MCICVYLWLFLTIFKYIRGISWLIVVIMGLKNEIFAKALDWLVGNKGIDGQKGLAEAIGISANTISRIMTGKVEPSADTLRKLADKFGFNMQWLRGNDKVPMFADCDINHHENNQVDIRESTQVDVDLCRKALENDANIIASLRKDIEYYQQLVLDKDTIIQEHNEQIVALQIENTRLSTSLEHNKTTLNAVRKNYDAKLDELAQRDQMIKMLESILESNRISSGKLSDFPGVADGDTSPLYVTDDIKKPE